LMRLSLFVPAALCALRGALTASSREREVAVVGAWAVVLGRVCLPTRFVRLS
jgi:hypothetical protein